MKSFAYLLVSLTALPLAVASPARRERADTLSSPGVISLPVRRETGSLHTAVGSRRLQRMGAPTSLSLAARPPRQSLLDRTEYYLAEIGIGTPPQPQALIVDTGGWVTWVNPDCSQAPRRAECDALPAAYNPAASSPSPRKVHDLDQVIYYGYTNGAALEGYADIFSWNDNASRVPAQAFGVANATVGVSAGILGLAPDGSGGFGSRVSNYSVVSNMAQQGLIGSRVFSLAFGQLSETANAVTSSISAATRRVGTLVFGGVDRNRFAGALARTAILPRDDSVDGWRYWVAVTEVRHNRPDGRTGVVSNMAGRSFNSTYMLDSGTTGIYVARDTYEAILADANLTRNEQRAEGFPQVDCSMRNQTGSLSFSFAAVNASGSSNSSSGFTINVPYASMIHPQKNLRTNESSCFFALSSGGQAYDDGDGFMILGVEFFKSAYVVFDWDNQEIGIAQGAHCGEPDLAAIGAGPNAMANLAGNCRGKGGTQ